MRPTRRDELNLLSARQKAVYGQEYTDEYGVTYVGNKKGRLERRSGASTTYVNDAVNNIPINNSQSTDGTGGTGNGSTTIITDSISPFLLMGG